MTTTLPNWDRLERERQQAAQELYDSQLRDPDTEAALRWLREHGATGILNQEEVADMRRATARVFFLLADGQWHDAVAIRVAAGSHGQPAAEGLRRMRDLRRPLARYGLRIEKQRTADSRLFSYRLVKAGEG